MELSTTDSLANIDYVRKKVVEVYGELNLLASLTFIQAILEADLRRPLPSLLAFRYNNLFGIKGEGSNGTVSLPTKEFIKGKMITVDQNFAVNRSVKDSIEHHKRLLEKPRYAKLHNCKTFEEIANAVYKAGYATDPQYPQKLIDLYNKYLRRH
jgi:flagellum-specific peptidoglycan hydrolase FlgJ